MSFSEPALDSSQCLQLASILGAASGEINTPSISASSAPKNLLKNEAMRQKKPQTIEKSVSLWSAQDWTSSTLSYCELCKVPVLGWPGIILAHRMNLLISSFHVVVSSNYTRLSRGVSNSSHSFRIVVVQKGHEKGWLCYRIGLLLRTENPVPFSRIKSFCKYAFS